MSTITIKQQAYIRNLARETKAYDGTDGLTILGGRAYPKLCLQDALDGTCSTRTASKIIEVLLAAPKAYSEEELEALRVAPTEKQLGYATYLAECAGVEINMEGMTRKEVSNLIDELLPKASKAASRRPAAKKAA